MKCELVLEVDVESHTCLNCRASEVLPVMRQGVCVLQCENCGAFGPAPHGRIRTTDSRLLSGDAGHDPVHSFFGLSYASYLVLPRTLLQSCSQRAQQALCAALELIEHEESEHMKGHWPGDFAIAVTLRDGTTGKFVRDELADYQRGRRRLWDVQAQSVEGEPTDTTPR